MAEPATALNTKTVELPLLAKTQLFKDVSMAQVGPLLKFAPTLELAGGDKLFTPGQLVDKVYLLLQGHLKVFSETSADTPVAEIKPGECVGLASFVDRQACHVTVVCTLNSRLLPIDERLLLTLANSPTVFSRNLLFMLMKYMREKAARDAASAAPAETAASLPDHLKLVDPLTGLHNQRWLDETLDRLTLRSATDCKPLSIVAVDLFQPADLIADLGQEVADTVLRETAGMLRTLIRPTDLLARHANGRFILMLPDTNLDSANIVTARIEEAVNATKIIIQDGCVLPPVRIVMGSIMMKAFVAGRKLVADAMAVMEKNREIQLDNLKALTAAETAGTTVDSALTAEPATSEPEQAAPVAVETTMGDERPDPGYTTVLDNTVLSTIDGTVANAEPGTPDTLASGTTAPVTVSSFSGESLDTSSDQPSQAV